MTSIKVGTRQSDLALTQTRMVQKSLERMGRTTELVKVVTTGDTDLRAFEKIPGDGFFTKELEKQLLQKKIDLAVHSCKDLPSMTHDSLPWFSYSQRESVQDILITPKKNINADGSLKKKLVLGTSSPRRILQLQKLFPTCTIKNMRGNVPSRIDKTLTPEYDAAVLAEAGVNRLQLKSSFQEKNLACLPLPTVSAPCQGILALQSRRENVLEIQNILNPELDRLAKAEKSILALFGGGCHLALGANIETHSAGYQLKFFLQTAEVHSEFQKNYASLTDLLRGVVAETLSTQPSEHRLWLTQPLQHQFEIAKKLATTQFETLALPLLEVRPSWTYEEFLATATAFQDFTSLVFTSRFGVRLFFLEFLSCFPEIYSRLSQIPIYCIGPSTAEEFKKYSDIIPQLPKENTGLSLFESLPQGKPLLAGTPDSELKKYFEKSGKNYTFLNLYKGLKYDGPLNDFTSAKKGDSVVLTSPKAARIFVETYMSLPTSPPLHVFAFGPTTSKQLETLKVPHQVNPISGSWDSMIEMLLKSI